MHVFVTATAGLTEILIFRRVCSTPAQSVKYRENNSLPVKKRNFIQREDALSSLKVSVLYSPRCHITAVTV